MLHFIGSLRHCLKLEHLSTVRTRNGCTQTTVGNPCNPGRGPVLMLFGLRCLAKPTFRDLCNIFRSPATSLDCSSRREDSAGSSVEQCARLQRGGYECLGMDATHSFCAYFHHTLPRRLPWWPGVPGVWRLRLTSYVFHPSPFVSLLGALLFFCFFRTPSHTTAACSSTSDSFFASYYHNYII